jgi:peptidoglycan-N-acetylglucosamine deacetylase
MHQWLTENALKLLWSSASLVGLRRLNLLLSRKAYGDTCFFFEGKAVQGTVALTIDDGLCRHGAKHSMVDVVAGLLRQHNAHATFFVCTKYLCGLEEAARGLVADGHELGNHLAEDLHFIYPKLSPESFDEELSKATAAIEAAVPDHKVRWFRAPQGMMTSTMADSVRRQGLRSALGDAYADDWAMENNAAFVARTILQQARSGSVIILHQPEVGYREHTLEALRLVLEGLSERGMRVVTLSELSELASPGANEGKGNPIQSQQGSGEGSPDKQSPMRMSFGSSRRMREVQVELS